MRVEGLFSHTRLPQDLAFFMPGPALGPHECSHISSVLRTDPRGQHQYCDFHSASDEAEIQRINALPKIIKLTRGRLKVWTQIYWAPETFL